jgi:lipid II:glycine glycyltransferase (peptidoglycan interpeptide bridge formation enzyme)
MMVKAPPVTNHESLTTNHGQFAIAEPDARGWDAFTARHPQGHLLQSSGWGALKQQVGWQARRVLVVGPAGPQAGAQLLLRRRLGLSAAYVPRGPLFGDSWEVNALLLAALDRIARGQRAVFLRLEPNVLEDDPQAGDLHSALLIQGFRTATPLQPRTSLHLDLSPAPEQLLAGMSKGHRADIRRAVREGVAVRPGQGAADLAAFYTIMEQTAARAEFAIHSRAYYQAAWELFHSGMDDLPLPAQRASVPRGEDQPLPPPRPSQRERGPGGEGQLFLAEQNGVTLAACMIFAWAGAGLYLYGGSTEAGLKSGANHALQWHAIQWARALGCPLYDFWGVPDQFGLAAITADAAERARLEEQAKADPLYGVFRFKKGFGGQVKRYLPAYDRVYLPPLYALWQRKFGG